MSGPVRSLSQGFAILRLLAMRDALTLSDICRETGLSPSSGLNLLRTLVAEGAIERDFGGKRYRLAAGWGDLAVLHTDEVARFAARVRPLLARFAAAHDATAGLWQVQADERLSLIALGESGAETRIHMVEGQRQPLGGGAAGRALTAAEALDRAGLAARFARVRWRNPLGFTTWLGQVAEAVQRGYAVDDGYIHAGVCSVGVAVPGTPVRFCLSATIFAGSRDAAAQDELGRALSVLARRPELMPEPMPAPMPAPGA